MFKIILIMKVVKWFKGLFNGSDSTEILELSNDEFEKSKFKARIALVDDEEIPHVKRLRNEGYNVNDYNDIEVIDEFIRKKYHVVVLDIQGIGKKIAGTAEGWGILKYLKSECPHLVVIMFTGAEWSITKYKHLADQADDFMGKDLEYLDFKSKLDSAIKKAFSSKFQFEVTRKQIQSELSEDLIIKIESILNRNGGDRKKTIKEIKNLTNKTSVVNSIDSYLSIISSIKDLVE
jgi:DNA-binding NtrC family response regulator